MADAFNPVDLVAKAKQLAGDVGTALTMPYKATKAALEQEAPAEKAKKLVDSIFVNTTTEAAMPEGVTQPVALPSDVPPPPSAPASGATLSWRPLTTLGGLAYGAAEEAVQGQDTLKKGREAEELDREMRLAAMPAVERVYTDVEETLLGLPKLAVEVLAPRFDETEEQARERGKELGRGVTQALSGGQLEQAANLPESFESRPFSTALPILPALGRATRAVARSQPVQRAATKAAANVAPAVAKAVAKLGSIPSITSGTAESVGRWMTDAYHQGNPVASAMVEDLLRTPDTLINQWSLRVRELADTLVKAQPVPPKRRMGPPAELRSLKRLAERITSESEVDMYGILQRAKQQLEAEGMPTLPLTRRELEAARESAKDIAKQFKTLAVAEKDIKRAQRMAIPKEQRRYEVTLDTSPTAVTEASKTKMKLRRNQLALAGALEQTAGLSDDMNQYARRLTESLGLPNAQNVEVAARLAEGYAAALHDAFDPQVQLGALLRNESFRKIVLPEIAKKLGITSEEGLKQLSLRVERASKDTGEYRFIYTNNKGNVAEVTTGAHSKTGRAMRELAKKFLSTETGKNAQRQLVNDAIQDVVTNQWKTIVRGKLETIARGEFAGTGNAPGKAIFLGADDAARHLAETLPDANSLLAVPRGFSADNLRKAFIDLEKTTADPELRAKYTSFINKLENFVQLDPQLTGSNHWVAPGVKSSVEWEATARLGSKHPVLSAINGEMKRNLTARNPISHVNNFTSNLALQTLRTGDPSLVARIAARAADYKYYSKTGRSKSARAYRALEDIGLLDRDVLHDIPVRKNLYTNVVSLGGFLDNLYKNGDNIFKLQEATKNFNLLEKYVGELKENKYIEAPISNNRSLRITKLPNGQLQVVEKASDGTTLRVRQDGIYLGVDPNSHVLSRAMAEMAAKPALDIFFDYTDVPILAKAMSSFSKNAPLISSVSPFLSWGWKAIDLPGKPGLLAQVTKGPFQVVSNDPRIMRGQLGRTAATAAMRQAAVTAAREQWQDEQEQELLRYMDFVPHDQKRGLVVAMSHPENSTAIFKFGNWNSLNPTLAAFKAVSQLASGGSEEERKALYAKREGPAISAAQMNRLNELEEKVSRTTAEQAEFDSLSTAARQNPLTPDERKRLRLLQLIDRGELTSASGVLQLLGLSKTPIQQMLDKLEEDQKLGKKHTLDEAFTSLSTAMIGGAATHTATAAAAGAGQYMGSVDMPGGFTKTFTPEGYAPTVLQWYMHKLLGLGWNVVNLTEKYKENGGYFKRVGDEMLANVNATNKILDDKKRLMANAEARGLTKEAAIYAKDIENIAAWQSIIKGYIQGEYYRIADMMYAMNAKAGTKFKIENPYPDAPVPPEEPAPEEVPAEQDTEERTDEGTDEGTDIGTGAGTEEPTTPQNNTK